MFIRALQFCDLRAADPELLQADGTRVAVLSILRPLLSCIQLNEPLDSGYLIRLYDDFLETADANAYRHTDASNKHSGERGNRIDHEPLDA